MPKPIKVKLRAGNPIAVEMDNAFSQDPTITDEKVFDNSTDNMILKRIIISGPLDGYTSPLEIYVTNDQDELLITVEYEEGGANIAQIK